MAGLPRRTYMLAKRQKVIDNWATIIERGAGRDAWFLGEVEKMVIDADMSGLRSSQMNVQSGLFGQSRLFLVVSLDRLSKHTDFSVMRFRSDFMLVSEEYPVKTHKNQCV